MRASTPQRLVPLGSAGVRAVFLPERPQLSARAGQTISVPIVVKNTSRETFPEGSNVLGLSYHLLSSESSGIGSSTTTPERTLPQRFSRTGRCG